MIFQQVPLHDSVKQKDEDLEKKVITLFDCLDSWSVEETLSPNDSWYPSSKKH